jgi:RNA polymerase sigma factor (sigma-70 family)
LDVRFEALSGLDQAWAEHSRSCWWVARAIVRDDQLAEDVVQEAFLALWLKPDAFDPSKGELRTWLTSVTHHKAVDRVRWHHRRPTATLLAAHVEVDDPRIPSVEAHAVAADEAHEVRVALSTLPWLQREVISLAYFRGYSQSEIARLNGIPLGTVKTRTRAGLKALAQLLPALRPTVEKEAKHQEPQLDETFAPAAIYDSDTFYV